ncbi:LOW QUALITY PROTEIN: hypothetical protein MXB_3004 [Myxobolus squamalis]|nr:LOW QUALITY PROTEIN: hypothetical protein MXB_3004 [Myxobolus squamalis]
MMVEYIGANFNKKNDVLFSCCIQLLQAVMRELVSNSLQIFVKCQIQENWESFYELIESLVVKFQLFAVICVENCLFDDILHHLAPSFSSLEITETSILLLNFSHDYPMYSYLMNLVDASKYLVEHGMDVKLTKLLDECNNKFKASFSLILGNFCFNDKMAVKLVNCDKLHDKIISNLKQLFDSGITKTDPSFTVTILENPTIFETIVKYSHVENSNIITEELLCEVAKNVDAIFLATFFNELRANEIFFSILSEDNIKILLREKYFEKLYKLAVVPPYRPQLIINAIPAFKSLVAINDYFVEKKIQFIDEKLILALSSLTNYPQLLEGLDLPLIIDQFKQIINKI